MIENYLNWYPITEANNLIENGQVVLVYIPDETFDTKRQRLIRYYPDDVIWNNDEITHFAKKPEPPTNFE